MSVVNNRIYLFILPLIPGSGPPPPFWSNLTSLSRPPAYLPSSRVSSSTRSEKIPSSHPPLVVDITSRPFPTTSATYPTLPLSRHSCPCRDPPFQNSLSSPTFWSSSSMRHTFSSFLIHCPIPSFYSAFIQLASPFRIHLAATLHSHSFALLTQMRQIVHRSNVPRPAGKHLLRLLSHINPNQLPPLVQ